MWKSLKSKRTNFLDIYGCLMGKLLTYFLFVKDSGFLKVKPWSNVSLWPGSSITMSRRVTTINIFFSESLLYAPSLKELPKDVPTDALVGWLSCCW